MKEKITNPIDELSNFMEKQTVNIDYINKLKKLKKHIACRKNKVRLLLKETPSTYSNYDEIEEKFIELSSILKLSKEEVKERAIENYIETILSFIKLSKEMEAWNS